MGNSTFFVDWQLWMQMTFVLGCAIGLVMIAGMIKLWWINRRVKKHVKLDEEKRSRLSEMRSSGLAVAQRNEVPFGVRAIQKGVEVEGIWISRPTTPSSETPMVATPTGFGAAQAPLAKGTGVPEGVRLPHRPAGDVRTLTPNKTSPTATNFGAQSTYRPKHAPARPSPRTNESYNADALRSLEGSSVRPAPQTYMPSRTENISRSPYGQNTTNSSDIPEYYTQKDQRNPFSTPEPSEHGSPEETSPFEEVYTGEVQSSHTQRGNAGVNVQYSTAEASQVDLERGGFPSAGNGRGKI